MLGPMIGSGSFGRCYRGNWHGATVAVKASGTVFSKYMGRQLAFRVVAGQCHEQHPMEHKCGVHLCEACGMHAWWKDFWHSCCRGLQAMQSKQLHG